MIAITNGKVVTVTGQTFENGTVLIEDGKIKTVGQQIAVPQDAQVIDAAGCWVTPGLIDCHTHISNFNEPGTLTGSDGNEVTDPLTPQVRAMDAVNPYDYAISKVREAGFTTVCILPGSANVIGGTGIVIKLHDVQSAEEMCIRDRMGDDQAFPVFQRGQHRLAVHRRRTGDKGKNQQHHCKYQRKRLGIFQHILQALFLLVLLLNRFFSHCRLIGIVVHELLLPY